MSPWENYERGMTDDGQIHSTLALQRPVCQKPRTMYSFSLLDFVI